MSDHRSPPPKFEIGETVVIKGTTDCYVQRLVWYHIVRFSWLSPPPSRRGPKIDNQ